MNEIRKRATNVPSSNNPPIGEIKFFHPVHVPRTVVTNRSGETASSSVQEVMEDLEQAERRYLHQIETMPEDERAAVKLQHIMGKQQQQQQQPVSVEFVRVITERPKDEPTQIWM